MPRRTLRLLAVGYLVKALLVGIAWILVPDLPERTMTALRSTLGTSAP
ncbi:MAG TPA: hypothetical protein VFM88_03880 [Vicinamibacteria bacterium]|nr:hypothetical protein [Vicinamibacteria bacterium]